MSLLSPQLEAFIAIAQCKTVHGAANILHITQTAVTQRIRGLEAKLKTTLFIRSRRGMLLTQEGEALIRYCQAARALEGEALATIQGAAIETEINLAITGPTSIMRARIIPKCILILKKFPQLSMRFDIDDIEERQQKLKTGHTDFAIIQKQDVAKEMAFKNLKSEQYILVCCKAWKNRKLRDIITSERIIDFNPHDSMTFNYLKKYELFEGTQHQRHFVNRTESLATMVTAGLGYTTLAKEFAKPYIEDGSLIALNSGKTFDHSYVLAWYARPEPPRYFAAIVSAIE
jgi:LysR family transcriptional regulator (chromosome initiation inhibitor)